MQNPQQKIDWIDRIHGQATAWIILCISVIITVIAWSIATNYSEQKAMSRFEYAVNDTETAIEKRFVEYEQVLRSGLALFESTASVNRTVWNKYITTLNLDKYYPGTLGVGYAKWLSADELPNHIKNIRAEGFPDYSIRPAGVREQYTSIIYLEPFNAKNRRAFGFDMYSENTRRTAMLRALETGETALSGKVTLVQETKSDVQAGFLLYIPHYSQAVKTLAERQKYIEGFVYSALRIKDLMEGIFASRLAEINFQIYDTKKTDEENLLYDSSKSEHVGKIAIPTQARPKFTTFRQATMGGHTWTINYSTNNIFDEASQTGEPMLVAIGGIIIDILLFNVILSLSRLRKKALILADVSIEKLNEQEMHFKAISDTAYDGIISLSSNSGVVTYANRSARNIFNLKNDDIVGQKFVDFFPDIYHEELNAIISFYPDREFLTEHRDALIEMQAYRKNSEAFPVEMSTAYWSHNDVQHLTISLRDITDRKRIEKMKNEFISTVSHELRTPLTAIFGSLSLVGSGVICKLNAQAEKLVLTAKRNCERLTRLVNDILDVEKMESGKMVYHFDVVDVREIMQRVIDDNKSVAQQASVNLVLKMNSAAMVWADIDRFIQLITNLISNAIKFSPENKDVLIEVCDVDNNVRIEVSDKGQGIPDEFRDAIFSKFSQSDSTDSRIYGGTGLGLNIAKNIILQHNGDIGYVSSVGEGSTFYITLPIYKLA